MEGAVKVVAGTLTLTLLIVVLVMATETHQAVLSATTLVQEERLLLSEMREESREVRRLTIQALKDQKSCEEANDEHEKLMVRKDGGK